MFCLIIIIHIALIVCKYIWTLSVSSNQGLNHSQGHHVVFFKGKTFYSCGVSPSPGVQMGAREFNAGGKTLTVSYF